MKRRSIDQVLPRRLARLVRRFVAGETVAELGGDRGPVVIEDALRRALSLSDGDRRRVLSLLVAVALGLGLLAPPAHAAPEKAAGRILDASAAGDVAEVARLWATDRAELEAAAGPLKSDAAGSGNIPPISAAAGAVAGDRRMAAIVVEYCTLELDGSHGGWGWREPLSGTYWWPVPAVEATGRRWPEVAAACQPLLRGWAYLLALLALPEAHPAWPRGAGIGGAAGGGPTVWSPGSRSQPERHTGRHPSVWLAELLRPGGELRRDLRRTTWSTDWPARVAASSRHDYLSAEERTLLADHIAGGRRARGLVAVLQELGCHLRWTMDAWRYASGDWVAYADRSIHGSTPPTLAVSRTGRAWHVLRLHPPGVRGGSGRSLGRCRAWQEGAAVRGRCEGVQLRRVAGDVLEGAIPAPRPDQPALYGVRIGPSGVALLEAAP